jgi:hypothetical protein
MVIKKKKARNLPKSSTNLDNLITFFLKCADFFEIFSKSSLVYVAWDLFLKQNDEFLPPKISLN